MSDHPFQLTQEIILAARRNATQGVWDYVNGAAETETTMRRNRRALDRLAFCPRVLRDVSEVDPSTEFLGHRLRIPVLLAPMGSLQMLTPDGGVAVAKAAAEFGTIQLVSTVTQPSMEEISAATDAPKIFQIYIRGDESWTDALIDRAKAAGFWAFALTVDSAYYGRRERQMAARWLPESFRQSGDTSRRYQSAMTWEWMLRMRDRAKTPFMIKGVQTPADAELCVKHGIDVVYVSNHGGRQMDHVRGTLDMLPGIVAAVGGKAKVVVDGGIVRGTDVLKAIALGADAVAIGRLQAWALAAGGTPALVRQLEILESEIKNGMGLIGASRLDQLDPSFLVAGEPMTEAREFGAFPYLPDGVA